jgi:predicted DNA-binding transcriptional regulator AlpA
MTKPKLLRTADVCKIYSISRSTLCRALREWPDFPAPVRLAGQNLFPVDELDAFFEGKRG